MSIESRWCGSFIFVLAFSLELADPTGAQTCFQGKPAPECRSFWITEAGLSFPIDAPHRSPAFTATMEFGHAWNQGERSAWGATAFLRAGKYMEGVGVRPRYQYWFNRNTALDVAPGVRFWNRNSEFQIDFSGQVGVNHQLVGLVLQVDSFETWAYELRGLELERVWKTETMWSLGGRFGNQWGAFMGVFGTLVAIVFTAVN